MTRLRRILHRLLLLLLPDCRYRRVWLSYYRHRWFFENAGYTVLIDRSKVLVSGHGITITGDSENTILTACGVLCGHEYDFYDTAEYLVIDIGLNIGITSVFLACKENVKKIYAYEPFLPTLRQAERNLHANACSREKVQVFPWGLGNEEKQLTFHYNPDAPGSMSTVRDVYPDAPFAEYVVIKPASRELATVFAEHAGLKKALKIDCEGSEMEILEDLKKAGLLAQVDLILLEWHFGYGRDLIDLLTDCGFVLTCRHDIPEKQGVITAFRSKTAV